MWHYSRKEHHCCGSHQPSKDVEKAARSHVIMLISICSPETHLYPPLCSNPAIWQHMPHVCFLQIPDGCFACRELGCLILQLLLQSILAASFVLF